MAGIHTYTDFGYAPFQPLWGMDFYGAGLGKKPVWITSMSDDNDGLLAHALLCAARGADGIDLCGRDANASRAISRLFARYGPAFRCCSPLSEVAMLVSQRQQVCDGAREGHRSGYSSGGYYRLYTMLWFARRPLAPGKLAILDQNGQETWSVVRAAGAGEARLTPDGAWLIVRPETPRNHLYAPLGPAPGLESIKIEDKTCRAFPLTTAEVASWTLAGEDGRVFVSTADGVLRCFRPDTSLIWEKRFAGASSLLASADGKTILLGTSTGALLWLDAEGNIARQVDLMPYHRVRDSDAYVRAYTRRLDGIANRQPRAAAAAAIDQRCGKAVKFSANLLAGSSPLLGADGSLVKEAQRFSFTQKRGTTYVISFFARNAGGIATAQPAGLRVRMGAKAGARVAVVWASATWEERTLAWRAEADGQTMVEIEPLPRGEAGALEADVRSLAVFALEFPSPNVLRQKGADKAAPDMDVDKTFDDVKGDEEIDEDEAPDAEYFMPNDVDLAARARGAPPFALKMPPYIPFDGKLANEETSWLKAPLSGSTYATLTLSFKKPRRFTALAVYEDDSDPRRITDTYAIFLREAQTGQWRKVGHVIGNRSPFNLFICPATAADRLVYLWLKSGDGHARIAEWEGYAREF